MKATWYGAVHTLRVARTFSLHFALSDAQTRTRRGSRCLQWRMSYLSISPSPFSCFIRLSCCSLTVTSRAPSLPNCSRSESAGQAHLRTSGGEFGHLADSMHSTGYDPKEFDRMSPADGDHSRRPSAIRTTITSLTSRKSRENTGLFGVSTMSDASVSHVSRAESKASMHRDTVARQREKKEKVP